jgi:ribonuclease HII
VGPGACGLDEVGRGALAGPLVAAAVILPNRFRHPLLRDSKLLSAEQRQTVEPLIRQAALAVEVVSVTVDIINDRGIGWANRYAFERLIELVIAPAYLLDGNLRINTQRRYHSVVSGDRLVPAISAASIVAKVHRDRMMRELHPEFLGAQQGLRHPASPRGDLEPRCLPAPSHRLRPPRATRTLRRRAGGRVGGPGASLRMLGRALPHQPRDTQLSN